MPPSKRREREESARRLRQTLDKELLQRAKKLDDSEGIKKQAREAYESTIRDFVTHVVPDNGILVIFIGLRTIYTANLILLF